MNVPRNIMNIFVLFSVVFLLTGICYAIENDTENAVAARVIGVVKLDKNGVSQHIFKQVDRLIPELKKNQSDKIIRLECRYSGASSREADVKAAYSTAGKIEKYLRERHKLKLDLWISAQLLAGKHEKPQLIFSVLSDEIKQHQTLPVNPAKEKP